MSGHSFYGSIRCFALTAVLTAALAACAAAPPHDAGADAWAVHADMRYQEVMSGGFRIATYARIRDANQPVTIYVDGDTRGWIPSADPGIDATPDQGLGLRLAALDPAPNVVYIAHPCQFTTGDISCADMDKPDTRYAELILTSINRAIDHAVIVFPHPRINLVGYSGGAAIAVILATRREDVVSLRTIAGNLDPEGNARNHAADAPEDFVDPLYLAPRLANLPQEHFVGSQDEMVPPFLTQNFVKEIGTSYCVKVTVIPGATHKTGWEAAWKTRAAPLPLCDALLRP